MYLPHVPCTLYPAPSNLHPAPCSLHPSTCSLEHNLRACTLHCAASLSHCCRTGTGLVAAVGGFDVVVRAVDGTGTPCTGTPSCVPIVGNWSVLKDPHREVLGDGRGRRDLLASTLVALAGQL